MGDREKMIQKSTLLSDHGGTKENRIYPPFRLKESEHTIW